MTAATERLYGVARKVGDVKVTRYRLPNWPYPFSLEFGGITIQMTPEVLNGLFADCAAEVDMWEADAREAAKPPLTEPVSEEDR